MVRLVFGAEAGEDLNRTVCAELRTGVKVIRDPIAGDAPPPKPASYVVSDAARIARLERTGSEPIGQPGALTLAKDS